MTDDPRLLRLQQLKDEFTRFPGAAPGGTGLTGLLPNDAQGWSDLQNRRTEYENLMRELQGKGPLTVSEKPDPYAPSLRGLQQASGSRR